MVKNDFVQLLTPWGESLNPEAVLQEYPRPQLRRESYLNLNGFWNYAITDGPNCEKYDGQILVPFSPESVLSGVSRTLEPHQYLHYQRKVSLPEDFVRGPLLLHFGAVDQVATVNVNGQAAGQHTGGYTPFSLDITDCLTGADVDAYALDIRVTVQDCSDTSWHQTGKQRLDRGGIWYTPQSGIWQTVWLESVPDEYIKDLTLKPALEEGAIRIGLETTGDAPLAARAYLHGRLVGSVQWTQSDSQSAREREWEKSAPNAAGTSAASSKELLLELSEVAAWSPENPVLYDLEIDYGQDSIKSYFGMRHFSVSTDAKGRKQFFLNQKPYFQSGLLDQGYYSDGLLTPPSDEAMIADIELARSMGFTMLRKHIKIEPLRWYYHCDRLGMLVWQDMVNGSERKDIILHGALAIAGIHLKDSHYSWFGRQDECGRIQWEGELAEMLAHLKNVVSINTWVPFNEAWGQFDAARIAGVVASVDETRLIDHASGWSDQRTGDYHSRHIYFTKIRFSERSAKKRILALTEFGGYSLPEPGHLFHPEKIFGYKKYEDRSEYCAAVIDLYETQVLPQIAKGLNALVYTQLTDVEDEINGLITYDRKKIKMDPASMNTMNARLVQAFKDSVLD